VTVASRFTASAPRLPAVLLRPAMWQLGRWVLDPGLPWQTQRQRLDWVVRAIPAPRGTVVARSVMNGVNTEVVTALGARPERTVVCFHGGGYCVGSAHMSRIWAATLSAQAACRVVVPQYRLAPAHRHPAALDDACHVLDAVLSDAATTSVVVAGDSAGGGLALAVILARRDRGEELPAGCILLSPWLDLGTDRRAVPELVRRDKVLSPRWLEACALAYTHRANWADPSVSPLLAAHSGLPPLLIQAGSDELLAPDAGRLAASASAAGVDVTYTRWPRMWHDFALVPGLLAAADSALSQAAWFVRTVTGHACPDGSQAPADGTMR
jgi:epsilon-lactone hydrolase